MREYVVRLLVYWITTLFLVSTFLFLLFQDARAHIHISF